MTCLGLFACWSFLTGIMAATDYFSLIGAAVMSTLAMFALVITTK